MGNSVSASGFDAKSTCSDVIRDIDLTGKNIIITGANSGIGILFQFDIIFILLKELLNALTSSFIKILSY